jgi:hypothetical protein
MRRFVSTNGINMIAIGKYAYEVARKYSDNSGPEIYLMYCEVPNRGTYGVSYYHETEILSIYHVSADGPGVQFKVPITLIEFYVDSLVEAMSAEIYPLYINTQ